MGLKLKDNSCKFQAVMHTILKGYVAPTKELSMETMKSIKQSI